MFFMGFQPWGEQSATDCFENAPKKWFENQRCFPRYHRTNNFVYEDWRQAAFSVMCH